MLYFWVEYKKNNLFYWFLFSHKLVIYLPIYDLIKINQPNYYICSDSYMSPTFVQKRRFEMQILKNIEN